MDVYPSNAAEQPSYSVLDKYALKLSAWLKTEAAKSRKQRRSLKQMHIDLCALGFEGSYDRVAAFARQWRLDQLERVNFASKGTRSVHSYRDGVGNKLCNSINIFL